MKRLLSLLTATAIILCPLESSAKKIHTIGDSTMANYDESRTVTRGWCQYLQKFLKDIEVNNRGKAGSSTRSFYLGERFWPTVKEQMEPGDYLLIQFAHNDEKNNGMDGDEVKAYLTERGDTLEAPGNYRGTNPSTTYKEYLRKYVDETRALGCEPILVGPICRMYFAGDSIRRNGRHDLGDNFSVLTSGGILENQSVPASDRTMDYVQSMKDIAAEKGVPFVDLTSATADLYLSYGDEPCHTTLGDGAGSTHLSETGAARIARLFVEVASRAGILSEYADLPDERSVVR